MTIKSASKEDADLIAQIYRSDIGKYGTTHNEQDVMAISQNVAKELAEVGTNRIVLIGLVSGRPVGTVQLVFDHFENSPELADGKAVAHIHHLRVAYDLHKTGKGKILMEKVEQIAKDRDFKKLTLVVDDWNHNAIDFYLHRGYRRFKDNQVSKEIYMFKEIS